MPTDRAYFERPNGQDPLAGMQGRYDRRGRRRPIAPSRQPKGAGIFSDARSIVMTETAAASANFEGLEVVTFESRRAREMAALITRFGGVPRVAAALREVPLEENAAALKFGEALLAGRLDAVIFMTGVGASRLFEVLETRYTREKIVQALGGITVVARG